MMHTTSGRVFSEPLRLVLQVRWRVWVPASQPTTHPRTSTPLPSCNHPLPNFLTFPIPTPHPPLPPSTSCFPLLVGSGKAHFLHQRIPAGGMSTSPQQQCKRSAGVQPVSDCGSVAWCSSDRRAALAERFLALRSRSSCPHGHGNTYVPP